MRLSEGLAVTVTVILLAGCADEPAPLDASTPDAPATSDAAAPADTPAPPEPGTQALPFKPAATVLELMNGTIVHAAEDFWGAVAVVVDADGVHELYPETDEQWLRVWAAAITIAESGNLLLIPPRAIDEAPWRRYSQRLIDAGIKAAAAAQAQDPEQVFATGEEIYNVCTACHMFYSPDARATPE